MTNDKLEQVARIVRNAMGYDDKSIPEIAAREILAACEAEAGERERVLREALERIVAPLANPPETQDGDESWAVAAWWRGKAIHYRTIARAAIHEKKG